MEIDRTSAIIFFAAFVGLSGVITVWAASRSKSTSEYLVAGSRITAWQNALAMVGEYMSASALLGMTGFVALVGFKGYIYSIAAVASWPIILFLFAEPIRRLGRYTLTDVLAWRFRQRPIRLTAAASSIPITLFYLIGQLVAAGVLVRLLFGLPYAPAVVVVGALMLCYVLFGGMLATTWVQIIKAVLMMVGVIVLTVLLLSQFDYNPLQLFRRVATDYGSSMLVPGDRTLLNRWDTLSLAIGILCGACGMPQILTRFFTVPDVRAAKRSAFYATCTVSVYHLMVLLIGFGALVLVGKQAIVTAGGGGNMAVPLLAAKLGGGPLFGFICGTAFATVLAVVAGLTLSSATTFAHDIWATFVRPDRGVEHGETGVAKIAACVIAVAAVALALLFENANAAFLIGLAQAIAASSNFPILVLALFWKPLTTRGAVAGFVVGVASSLILIIASPSIMIDLLHLDASWLAQQWWYFPMYSPTIVSLPLALAATVLVSLASPESTAAAKYIEMRRLLKGSPSYGGIPEGAHGSTADFPRLGDSPTSHPDQPPFIGLSSASAIPCLARTCLTNEMKSDVLRGE